jgi:hypothetical protein
MVMKGFQKNGTIQAIEHAFVWRIIYKQCVPSVNITRSKKENVKVLVENWFVKFIRQEMQILHAKFLIKHSGSMCGDLCFLLDVIQAIIYIMTLGYILNINLEL